MRPWAKRAKAGPKTRARSRNTGAKRPVLVPVSEAMKEWSAMLGAELETWPGVSKKPMFGLVSFYRGRDIFAALPKTRSVGSSSAFMFKLDERAPSRKKASQDSRIGSADISQARWLTFEIHSTADLRDALKWLDRAYLAARARE